MAVDNPERYTVPLNLCSDCTTKVKCEYEFQFGATEKFAVAEFTPLAENSIEEVFEYRDKRYKKILAMAEEALREVGCQLSSDQIDKNIDRIARVL